MTKSRFWFSAYRGVSGRRMSRHVLESTEGSLRLFEPKRRDSLIRAFVSLGFGAGILVAYLLLANLTASRFFPSQSGNGFPVLLTIIAFVGFFVTIYYSGGLGDRLGTGLELHLTAKHPDRIFLVHVRHVKPTASRATQLLRLVGDRKDEWFRVVVFGPDLIEALKLAKENIKLELSE